MLVSVVIDIAGAEACMMEVSCGRFSECAGSSEKSNYTKKKHKSCSNPKIHILKTRCLVFRDTKV